VDIRSIITEDFFTVNQDTTVTEFVGKLKQAEKKAGLIFRHDKYLGVVEKKSLLRAKPDSQQAKVENYLMRTPILSEDASVLDAAYLLSQGNFEFIPVQKNRQISGILRALDLLTLCKDLPDVAKRKVKEIKIRHVSSVNKDDPLAKATRIMHEEHVDHVPVFAKGKLYGILSYTDLLMKYINWSPKREGSRKFSKMASTRSARPNWIPFSNLPVENFSTNYNLITIQEHQTLREAITFLVDNKVSDLLVMKGEKYRGLITLQSILLLVASLKEQSRYEIQFKGAQEADLTENQRRVLQTITEREAEKLQRKISQAFKVTVHLKEIRKESKRHVFDVALHIEYPGKLLSSEKSDWRLERALHKCFNVVTKGLEK